MKPGQYVRTPEHRKQAREASLRLGLRPPSRLGSRGSERQKMAASEVLKKLWLDPLSGMKRPSFKGRKHTKESNEKNRRAHLGRKLSDEHRRKIAVAATGRKHSESTRKKLSEMHRGEKSPFWKGGISAANRTKRANIMSGPKYKRWRRRVFKRDNYTCQNCGERGGELHADHIKSFIDYPTLRFRISNGRTLCKVCHQKTPNFGGRVLRRG